MQVTNGIPATQLPMARWRKSRASNPSGCCVEVAELPNGAIAVRNSRDPAGPALVYTRAEVAAFLAGVKNGEFDDLYPAGNGPSTFGDLGGSITWERIVRSCRRPPDRHRRHSFLPRSRVLVVIASARHPQCSLGCRLRRRQVFQCAAPSLVAAHVPVTARRQARQ